MVQLKVFHSWQQICRKVDDLSLSFIFTPLVLSGGVGISLLIDKNDDLSTEYSTFYINRSNKFFKTHNFLFTYLLNNLNNVIIIIVDYKYFFSNKKNSRHFFELIDSLDPLLPTLPLRDRKCPASQLQQRSGRRNKQRDQSHEKICPHGYRNFLNFRVRIYRIQGLVFQDHSILHTEKTA